MNETQSLATAILQVKEALGLTDDEAWGPPMPGSVAEAFQTIMNDTIPEQVRSDAIIQAMRACIDHPADTCDCGERSYDHCWWCTCGNPS